MKILCATLIILLGTLIHAHASSFSADYVEKNINSYIHYNIAFFGSTPGMNDIRHYHTDQSPYLASLFNTVNVPEPATLFILGSSLIVLSSTMRRKLKNN